MSHPAAILPTPVTMDEIRDLCRRAGANDPDAKDLVRDLVKQPGWIERLGGDIVRRVEASLLHRIKPNINPHDLIVARAEVDQQRQRLTHTDDPPIVRVLIERAVTAWLHVHVLELEAARSRDPRLDRHLQPLLDRAHSRHLTALKTLAAVRKISAPTIQVNIARQQVNVAG